MATATETLGTVTAGRKHPADFTTTMDFAGSETTVLPRELELLFICIAPWTIWNVLPTAWCFLDQKQPGYTRTRDSNECSRVASLHSSMIPRDTGPSYRMIHAFHLFWISPFSHYCSFLLDPNQIGYGANGLLRLAYGWVELLMIFPHHCYFTTLGLLCIIPDQGYGARKGPFHLIHELDHYYPAALLFRTWPEKRGRSSVMRFLIFLVHSCFSFGFHGGRREKEWRKTILGSFTNRERPKSEQQGQYRTECIYIPSERIISTTHISLPWLSTIGYFLSSFFLSPLYS